VANFPGSDRRSVIQLDRWPKPPACAGCSALPIDLRLTFQLSPDVLPRARLATTSDSHLALILQLGWLNGFRFSPAAVRSFQLAPDAAATSSSHWLLPLLPNRRQTSDSHRLFPSGFTGFRATWLAPHDVSPGWAFDAPLASTKPCIAG
jgi:hypothetical protein